MTFRVISILFLFLVASCSPGPYGNEHGVNQPVDAGNPSAKEVLDLSENQIAGWVKDHEGSPIQGALVRLQSSENYTMSGEDGAFLLTGLPAGENLRITAFAPGYYIKETDVRGGWASAEIQLEAHSLRDNPQYEWLSAGISNTPSGDGSVCADCHSSEHENIFLPFDEWILDAHSSSGTNPRFLSMYYGTDLEGNQSPPTVYVTHRDYGRTPIRPKLDEGYFGPGFLLDFPESAGNCASCHLPLAAVDGAFEVDPNHVVGIEKEEGINCDFCHKIWGVKLDQENGLPYSNMPGVLSLELLRPPEGHQLFIGPLDDVAPGEDTYSPLQNQSQYCAACHFGDFWGVNIYNSFGEWLDSPYADPDSGIYQTCQDCHMPHLGQNYFALQEKGGLKRDPDLIFSHKFLGASDVDFLQNTGELTTEAFLKNNQLEVNISFINTNAGHHIPTDSPLRQIYLIVDARNQEGEPLSLLKGPTLPDWTGDLAALPGKYYAKILQQLWTEMSPTGAYWTQTRIIEDTRLPALETDQESFLFEAEPGMINITVTVLFRRAYYDLMTQKGWEVPDIIMEQSVIVIDGD